MPDLVKSNVSHNIIKLTRDLSKARSDWKNEHYFAFGEELGDMLVIATTPASDLLGADLTTQDYAWIMQGLIGSILIDENLTELEDCANLGIGFMDLGMKAVQEF